MDEYSEKGALAGPHQPVEFESDMISLDIPMEGITIEGWKITPLIRPVVLRVYTILPSIATYHLPLIGYM